MPVKMRKLLASDLQSFKQLRLEALQTNPESFGSHYARELAFTDQDFAARIEANEQKFMLGAFDGKLLVAIVGFYKVEDIGNIWGVFTTPEYRGQGISKQMMGEIIDIANADINMHKIQLGVTSESAAALGLYKAVGFETYSIEADAITHGEFSMCEILMELSV